MPVAALVVTLEPELAQQQRALTALTHDHQITLGALHGSRLPLVIEGDDSQQTYAAIKRAEQTPGVVLIEVVSVDFSDVEQ